MVKGKKTCRFLVIASLWSLNSSACLVIVVIFPSNGTRPDDSIAWDRRGAHKKTSLG
jgi:hypothetical protein